MDMALHRPQNGLRDTGNDSNDELNNVCAVDICNAISNLRMCGQCKSVRYCCKEHQKLDWKKHKPVCLKKSNAGSSPTTRPLQACDPEDALRKPPPTSNTTAAMTTPKVLFSLGDTIEPSDRNTNTSARTTTTTITGTNEQYTVQSTNGLGRTHGSTSSNSASSLLSRSSSGVSTSSCSSLDTAFQHLQSATDEDSDGPRRIPSDLQSKLQQESAIFSERLGTGYPLKPFESKGFGNMPPLQDDNIINGDCLPGENIKLHDLVKRVVKSLTTQHGICVLDNFLDERRGLAILKEVQQMHSSGQFQDGQVVRSRDDDSRKIRGDQIAWRNGHEPDCENISFLISVLDSILALCNGKLENYDINGRTKAMIACYPGKGSHYVRHVDNPNNDGRCITCIYYLNRNWDVSKNGGLLKVYPEGASGPAIVAPLFNRLLFFYSDRRNPHEVFPAYATRFAITVWYLDGNQKKRPVKM